MIAQERMNRSPNEVLEVADSFPMQAVIERYCRDYDVSRETGERHARELRRFLVLCALNPEVRYGMRGNVDDIWHTFLIYSRDYAAFCDVVAGTFVHHVPEGGAEGSESARAESRASYDRTLADYETSFGQPPPKDIWPRIAAAKGLTGSEACGSSCSRCGHGCSSCGHGCRGCTSCSHG